MTLANFIDELYGCQNLPVLVYDEDSYESMWDLVNDGIPIDEYGNLYGCANFALHMKYTDCRLSAFLNEKYTNAEVKHFIVTDECMLVFVVKHSER